MLNFRRRLEHLQQTLKELSEEVSTIFDKVTSGESVGKIVGGVSAHAKDAAVLCGQAETEIQNLIEMSPFPLSNGDYSWAVPTPIHWSTPKAEVEKSEAEPEEQTDASEEILTDSSEEIPMVKWSSSRPTEFGEYVVRYDLYDDLVGWRTKQCVSLVRQVKDRLYVDFTTPDGELSSQTVSDFCEDVDRRCIFWSRLPDPREE